MTDDDKRITLTYLNVRQSISILLVKLFAADIIMATLVMLCYVALIAGSSVVGYETTNTPLFLILIIFFALGKMLITAYVILLWLNEYYEITPEYIVHRRGVIFKKSEQYRFDLVRSMAVIDTFFGEIFNYGTITLYDIRLKKYLDMYLIHDPRRYARVIRQIRPGVEIKQDRINLPFMPKEVNSIEPK